MRDRPQSIIHHDENELEVREKDRRKEREGQRAFRDEKDSRRLRDKDTTPSSFNSSSSSSSSSSSLSSSSVVLSSSFESEPFRHVDKEGARDKSSTQSDRSQEPSSREGDSRDPRIKMMVSSQPTSSSGGANDESVTRRFDDSNTRGGDRGAFDTHDSAKYSRDRG